jgi:hypothetical protein
MKLTILSLLLTAISHGATLISSLIGENITSTVTLDNSIYKYKYVIRDKAINCNDVINRVSISLCDSTKTFKYFGDDPYKFYVTQTTANFNIIKIDGESFVFGYSSYEPPIKSNVQLFTSQLNYMDRVLVPKCGVSIPEPSSIFMLLLTLPLILNRRKS